VNWYESYLPPAERKSRGHFSTPPALVEYILDACGYAPDCLVPTSAHAMPSLNALRVLDPACGSGNFLSAVTRYLVAYGRKEQLSEAELCTLLQNSLWGFDPDPVACFLAEMQVRTTLEAYKLFPEQLHIHQADGLAFPWGEQPESVDLFLANPPYLATKNIDLSFYCSTEGRGQVDSYLLFLELALRVVRPGGWMGLVLPDAVLARANATRERQRLLNETTLHALWHFSGVFPAYVGAVVLIAQKKPPSHLHSVPWRREKWYKSEKLRQAKQTMTRPSPCVPQTLLRAQPHGEMRYLLGDEHQTLVARIQTYMHSTHSFAEQPPIQPLDTLLIIKRGEELGKTGHFISEATSVETHLPLLRGGIDVQPYATPRACNWLPRDAILKPLGRYLAPKLLVVKSTPKLQATLDVHGHAVLQTLYMLNIRCTNRKTAVTSEQELNLLYFLLALLNSDLLRTYVYVLHTAYKWVQPQIEQHVLAHLPIPALDTIYYAEVVQRAKEIMAACDRDTGVVKLSDHIKQLHTEQERTIVAMYQDALDRFVNKGVS